MARKLSVTVDHDLCVGNAMCVTIATKALSLNDERQAIPADVNADSEELIMEAAENCPVAAIRVSAAETGEQLFP
jgi:ferredoxin